MLHVCSIFVCIVIKMQWFVLISNCICIIIRLSIRICCSIGNCKNSFMTRKKKLWPVNFLKSLEYLVFIVIKMADVATG